MGMTRAQRQSTIDGFFAGTLELGFSTTTPDEAGSNFTEPAGNNYSRTSIASSAWDAATAADPCVVTNNVALTGPTATGGSWGTLTHWGLFPPGGGAVPNFYGPITVPKEIASGDFPQVPAGQATISLGDGDN